MGKLIDFPGGPSEGPKLVLPGDPELAAERLSRRQSPRILFEEVALSEPADNEPNYAGRLLCLNPEKATRFQCGGYILGGKLQAAVVPEEAQMVPIHIALTAGVLLDITESNAISTENTRLDAVSEEDTGKKFYITTSPEGERVLFATDDVEHQKRLDAQLAAGASKLVLPEGWENQEKYLIKVKPDLPAAPVKRSLKARIKDYLYQQIQKL